MALPGPARHGPVVAVTHELEEPDALVDGLQAAGAEVLPWSTVRTAVPEDEGPLSEALQRLESFQWLVFTSRRGVEAVRRLRTHVPTSVRIAAVGARVAGAVESAGWKADIVGTGGAEALAREMGPLVQDPCRVLFPAGALASGDLVAGLADAGARVQRVEAYRTVPTGPTLDHDAERLLGGAVSAITFLSPSAVDGLVAAAASVGCGDVLTRVPAVCVGATTSSRAGAVGFALVHTSARTSKTSVAQAVMELLQGAAAAEAPDRSTISNTR